ncbi:MAG: Fe-S cluster assembly protein SufD [Planctomycetota bacterium]|nr:Fe-S cluster assembly protein SufD [Planctomycetota bacterium]
MATNAIDAWTDSVSKRSQSHEDLVLGLKQRRADALDKFAQVGFPGRKHEEWRYTPLTSIASGPCSAVLDRSGTLLDRNLLPVDAKGVARIVIDNGEYRDDLSDLSAVGNHVQVRSLASMRRDHPEQLSEHLARAFPADDHPFHCLSDALLEDGVIIDVAPFGDVDGEVASIHLVHYFDGSKGPGSAHTTGLLHIARGARIRLIEEIHCQGEVLGNIRWGVELAEGADVHRIRAFRSGCASIFHGTRVVQQQDSRFEDVFTCAGADLVRNEIHILHEGRGCHAELLGAYVARGSEHIDNHTTIDHQVEDCTSREVYRGVLSDRSRGVFSGMIHVHEGAQRTDAVQSNDTILLSADAEADSRPRLEIYADDVKCTHGATVGELDEDALFYLRSRGISLEQARRMMVRAFTSEILVAAGSEVVSDFIVEELQQAIELAEEATS